MTEAAAFALLACHLGRNRVGDIHLHARVSETLDGICDAMPAGTHDVLDGHGDRLRAPGRPFAFTDQVGAFDITPAVPHVLVVHPGEAADQVAAAFPDMARRPFAEPNGIAFELDRSHLGIDPFGIPHLAEDVVQAIATATRNAPGSRARMFEGDGLPFTDRRDSFSERLAPLTGRPGSVTGLSGHEPQYIAFTDTAAAEAFARRFPGMARHDLAGLERLWRRARTSGN